MGKQSRPHIGINADLTVAGKNGPGQFQLHTGYVDAIVAAGGLPVLIPALTEPPLLEQYLDQLDGFLLSGGLDLDPSQHGLPSHPAVQRMPRRRDDSDRHLVRLLLQRRLPILGIGLGLQQLNVSCGGTLHLHLPEAFPRGLPHRDPSQGPSGLHRHAVRIEPGTHLEEIYGPGEIPVNSCHHQAVHQVARGFRVAATAPDGVIEAIETTEPDWFCVAVQWHPEAESATALDMQLFETLVQACLRPTSARRLAA
jgi:putative glutamine amidotransferase